MWDDKLFLSNFKTRRKTVIATMFSREEKREISIDKKKGNIFQTIEQTKTGKTVRLYSDLDFLIDRFKRTDQRKKQ